MTDTVTPITDELDILKARADKLGIAYKANIGIEALKAKLEEVLKPTEEPKLDTEATKRKSIRDEALKLVRIRITCLDPAKKGFPGEIFTIGNKYIGTVRKWVPYGDAGQVGWHVPYCIYKMLKDKKFVIKEQKSVNGKLIYTQKEVPAYAIELLPMLTEKELKDLAIEQSRTGRVDDNGTGLS